MLTYGMIHAAYQAGRNAFLCGYASPIYSAPQLVAAWQLGFTYEREDALIILTA